VALFGIIEEMLKVVGIFMVEIPMISMDEARKMNA
jgi:hypothetical protein